MKWMFTALLGWLVVNGAHAEDITTLRHQIYKNATISRAEPDGIVVVHEAGIVKIPFAELPEEYKARFDYDAAEAAKFAANETEKQRAIQLKLREDAQRVLMTNQNQDIAAEGEKSARTARQKAEKLLPTIILHAVVEPFLFEHGRTTAWIKPVIQIQIGHHSEGLNWVPTKDWYYTGEKFIGVLDEAMPANYERGDVAGVTLYKIGHTNDRSRNPLFTTKTEKAIQILASSEPNDG